MRILDLLIITWLMILTIALFTFAKFQHKFNDSQVKIDQLIVQEFRVLNVGL